MDKTILHKDVCGGMSDSNDSVVVFSTAKIPAKGSALRWFHCLCGWFWNFYPEFQDSSQIAPLSLEDSLLSPQVASCSIESGTLGQSVPMAHETTYCGVGTLEEEAPVENQEPLDVV